MLVNPVQSFHPNSPPPNDAMLLTSDVRKTEDSTARYAEWLRQLRELCSACEIPLIFDEVYTGFRLAPGGAQEYFGVRADMVVYGKTVAGGMPIGVVCGKKTLMRRFDPEAAHAHRLRCRHVFRPSGVMGAMNEFLRWVSATDTAKLYEESNRRCTEWVRATNQKLGRCRAALARGEPGDDMDGALQRTQPLQLAAAVLSARRRRHAQLGRHRALLKQHGLYAMMTI